MTRTSPRSRRNRLLLALMAGALAVVVPDTGPPVAQAATCPYPKARAGVTPDGYGLVTPLRLKHVSCSKAQKVVVRYAKQTDFQTSGTALGFRCRSDRSIRLHVKVTCRKGSASVAFDADHGE